jgi:arginyl-tRNA synthetase
MQDSKNALKAEIAALISGYAQKAGLEISQGADSINLETPPNPELGDLAFPCFPLAKSLRKAPPLIAQALAGYYAENAAQYPSVQTLVATGPYLNIKIKKTGIVDQALKGIPLTGAVNQSLKGRHIMIEFSCPNTNKPLHLGHLRNNALGESISHILKACDADVLKVNLINNRGVHICKSMLSYQTYGQGATPESTGVKGDHFVGDCYVKFNKLKEENPKAEELAQELLVKWEQNDPATRKLWETMNRWTINGMEETYRRTGISFDKVYLESETYLKGKDEVLRGLAEGIFYKADDGSIRINMEDIGLDTKVLLRSDGTSIYITQDIGTAIDRHKDWAFDQLIYVVASEQQYHFKVLFHILSKLGYDWAKDLYHLSYGLVNLPEGRMKTREGTVVDADDLLDQLKQLAEEEIAAKGREGAVGNVTEIAEKIALGALQYYLLQTTPTKDMIFNPKESLSFTGNTGPYVQYTGARIASLLRKAKDTPLGQVKPELLKEDAEWELCKCLTSFPEVVAKAAAEKNPSAITAWLYEISSHFSVYYHDFPILACPDKDIAATRLALAEAVLSGLKRGMDLALIPYLEAM